MPRSTPACARCPTGGPPARVAEIERDRIFRRTWRYAGHLGELDGPGSLLPARAGGPPVVVIRDG